jgi:TIR domain
MERRMGWVSAFEYDIFISYARVDNATVENNPDEGWVAQFHKHLEVALSKKVGRLDTVRIWRDRREIQGNQLFDQTIQDAACGSAVFVALSSNGYLQSDYCRQELKWFYQQAQTDPVGLAAGDEYRIFNVLLNNIPRSAWPAEYGRTTGFPLNDSRDPSGEGEPTVSASELFRGQLRAVAEAIYKTLQAIRDRNAVPSSASRDDSKKLRIYLADTSDTLAGVRKRIVNELKQSPDIELAAAVPPPFEAAGHDQAVRAELEEAQLSVHLLDAFPGAR